ncbi:glucuronate isomerase [Aestuariivivens sp. NBU2969]|uniref:glucuronate isomerase n=1 Tax=Aestuariivivens sp. NBU2969 TaxID=2873267 RepID=UPI001CBC3631|nr:glucuronate isomerase [Aestuariivivens sp. NBU2969]
MRNPIVDQNFLLHNSVAETLYHEYASKMPIIDYHCHIEAQEIAENRIFQNLSQIWLEGDHYKWRAMRANGISEKYITGEATDWEKFQKWAETVPYTIRNPLYHWTHLELKNPFGIQDILNENSAKNIYDRASEKLSSGELSVQNIMKIFNVEKVCTTNDPIDPLNWHEQITQSDLKIVVSMSWRPDRAMDVRDPLEFNRYLGSLEELSSSAIDSYSDYLQVLKRRHDYFHDKGCRLADHGLEFPFPIDVYTTQEISSIFLKIRMGKKLSYSDQQKIMSALLYEFSVWNFEKGWVQQYHIGALRDVNIKGVRNIGKACGFDSIADFSYAASMGIFLNRLEEDNQLAKTIIYNLNPKDNEMVASMIGNFQDGSVPGKIQYGSGWWFLDQKDGMIRQINTLSNQGLLSRFIGMLTDSRSFLSYSRHDYFRRILCHIIGTDVENGELPNDADLLGKIVQDISYNNANNYFDF